MLSHSTLSSMRHQKETPKVNTVTSFYELRGRLLERGVYWNKYGTWLVMRYVQMFGQLGMATGKGDPCVRWSF